MSPPPFLNLEYFYQLIYRWLTKPPLLGLLPEAGSQFLFWLRIIFLVLVPFLLLGVLWLMSRIVKLRREEMADLTILLTEGATEAPEKNERWEKVIAYSISQHPAEWKLAIIEADNILDDLLKKMQYPGENLGERLKAVEPSDFLTLNDAWEAHKVRNRIAHESEFMLSELVARETVARYKRVFEEFEYI